MVTERDVRRAAETLQRVGPVAALESLRRRRSVELAELNAGAGGLQGLGTALPEAAGLQGMGATERAATPTVVGNREPLTCEECGGGIGKRLVDGGHLRFWAPEAHACPVAMERERLAREAVELARAEGEAGRRWALEHPSDARVAEVRARVGLPRWGPLGVAEVRAREVDAAAYVAVARAEKAWRAGERPARGLWLWGGTGQRKTCLLSALGWSVAHRTTRTCVWWCVETLAEQWRREAQDRASRWDPVGWDGAEWVCLDDLGAVNVTPAVRGRVHGLVNGVYDRGGEQVLYVTSNEDPDGIERMFGGVGKGDRMVRRLVELCEVVRVGP